MYTIIMNENKELVTSQRATLYQREKLVDKIQFLFPQKYEDVDLGDCIPVLKYIDQGNISHSEILAKDTELYKDKLRFILPVDTNLNQFAGNIIIRITLNKANTETGSSDAILHTGEVLITIHPVNYVEPSAEFTDKLVSLEAQINAVAEKQVNGLVLTDDYLQVGIDGEPTGEGVNILVPGVDDGEYDGVSDGILDLDTVYPDTENDATEEDKTTPSEDEEDGFIEL